MLAAIGFVTLAFVKRGECELWSKVGICVTLAKDVAATYGKYDTCNGVAKSTLVLRDVLCEPYVLHRVTLHSLMS